MLSVPAVVFERETDEDGLVDHFAVSTELDAVRYRYADEVDQWLLIGDKDQYLDLSMESVRRLLPGLQRPLAD